MDLDIVIEVKDVIFILNVLGDWIEIVYGWNEVHAVWEHLLDCGGSQIGFILITGDKI